MTSLADALGRHRDALAGHAPAGGLLVVFEEVADGVLLPGGDGGEHLLADRVGQLLDDVSGDVVGDAAEDGGDAIRLQLDQQVVAVMRLDVGERGAELPRRQALHQQLADLVVDAGEGVGELRGVERVGEG